MSENTFRGVVEGERVGPPRASAPGALNAAVKMFGCDPAEVTVVEAKSAELARKLATPTFGFVEPTAEELAEAAAAFKTPRVTKALEVVSPAKWFSVVRDGATGDSRVESGPADAPGEMTPGTEGNGAWVEARTEYEARERVDLLAGAEMPLVMGLRKMPIRTYGTESANVATWFINPDSGMVHGDQDCRFVKKLVADGTHVVFTGGDLVGLIQARCADEEVATLKEARFRKEGLDFVDGDRKVRVVDYCRFCGVNKHVAAS